jgi:hypothetical protein
MEPTIKVRPWELGIDFIRGKIDWQPEDHNSPRNWERRLDHCPRTQKRTKSKQGIDACAMTAWMKP